MHGEEFAWRRQLHRRRRGLLQRRRRWLLKRGGDAAACGGLLGAQAQALSLRVGDVLLVLGRHQSRLARVGEALTQPQSGSAPPARVQQGGGRLADSVLQKAGK